MVRRHLPAGRTLVAPLVGLAAVLLAVGIVAVWANDLLLSPSHWESTSNRLLDDPSIRSSTATYAADQISARLHPSSLLGSGPGSVLGPLAGPSVGAVHAVIFRAVDAALGLPSVRDLWAQANRSAASAVVAAVDGRSRPAAVSIRLEPILLATATAAHLPTAVTGALPADARTLTIVQPDQVPAMQTAGRVIRILARWLVFLIPALWLAVLALARGERRRTLAQIGTSAAVAAVVVFGARALLVTMLAHTLSSDPALPHIMAAALATVTASLGHLAIAVGSVGLVVGVVAELAELRATGSLRLPRPRSESVAES